MLVCAQYRQTLSEIPGSVQLPSYGSRPLWTLGTYTLTPYTHTLMGLLPSHLCVYRKGKVGTHPCAGKGLEENPGALQGGLAYAMVKAVDLTLVRGRSGVELRFPTLQQPIQNLNLDPPLHRIRGAD